MVQTKQLRNFALIAGDIALLYFGLFATLFIRYGVLPTTEAWLSHTKAFFVIYAIWLILFYIFDLYNTNKFVSSKSLEVQLINVMVFAGIISVFIFYAFPYFLITPKIILILDLVISTGLLWAWRKIFYSTIRKGEKVNVIFLGDSKDAEDLIKYIKERPQLGYNSVGVMKDFQNTDNILEQIKNTSAVLVIVSDEAGKEKNVVQYLYNFVLPYGATMINFNKFYEAITGKIPVYQIEESWFLENLIELNKRSFEKTKEWMDFVIATVLLLIFFLLTPIVALCIKLNSKGPIFYRQKRVGKDGKIFEIIKFRSMVENAEKRGAQWAKEDDSRVTFVGNILRKTRIDELPQIWNVINGDLSFIGPRPERPEFVEELNKQIPHYSVRNIIKPGLSGWAQINFPYGSSVNDAKEKLQYDLYYIKNRSFLLDFIIALKTVAIIVRRQGR